MQHIVRDGECAESIAEQYGFLPEKIWEHKANADLREKRNSSVLKPGDVITIPDRDAKSVKVATNAKHTFRRKGVPSKFCVISLSRSRRSLWRYSVIRLRCCSGPVASALSVTDTGPAFSTLSAPALIPRSLTASPPCARTSSRSSRVWSTRLVTAPRGVTRTP